MLGERSDQRGLGKRTGCTWTTWGGKASTVSWHRCGAGCSTRAEFAEFYCPDNGRDSVPPSLLATALLLQYDKVSDAEATAWSEFDLGGKWRWD